MNNLTLDFLHYYTRGDRRETDPMAYQWDLGNVVIARIPATSDTIMIRYWQQGQGESQTYSPNSVETANNVTTVTANVPNYYFEKHNEIRVYVIAISPDQEVTTYEGMILVKYVPKPDDYVDDHPEGGAIPYIEQAKAFAEESEAWARGTINGDPVDSTAAQHNNNSKYYSDLAGTNAANADTSANAASQSAEDAASSAAAAAAILVAANDGMVVIDQDDETDQEYAVTFKVKNHHLVSTLTPAT